MADELRRTLKSNRIKSKQLSETIGRLEGGRQMLVNAEMPLDVERVWPSLLTQFSQVSDVMQTLPKTLNLGGHTSHFSVQPQHHQFDSGWVGINQSVPDIQDKKKTFMEKAAACEADKYAVEKAERYNKMLGRLLLYSEEVKNAKMDIDESTDSSFGGERFSIPQLPKSKLDKRREDLEALLYGYDIQRKTTSVHEHQALKR